MKFLFGVIFLLFYNLSYAQENELRIKISSFGVEDINEQVINESVDFIVVPEANRVSDNLSLSISYIKKPKKQKCYFFAGILFSRSRLNQSSITPIDTLVYNSIFKFQRKRISVNFGLLRRILAFDKKIQIEYGAKFFLGKQNLMYQTKNNLEVFNSSNEFLGSTERINTMPSSTEFGLSFDTSISYKINRVLNLGIENSLGLKMDINRFNSTIEQKVFDSSRKLINSSTIKNPAKVRRINFYFSPSLLITFAF